MRSDDSRRLACEAALWGLAGLVTRLPFATRLPYHWDTVQFILGMSHFDVRVHQPHPPGYLLYVWLGRALLPLADDPHRALLWLSALFSGLGAAVVFRLAGEALGPRAARTAALLFLAGPLFWFFGEVGLTYVVDFTFVGLVALYSLRLYRGQIGWGTVLGLALSLALAGGVRATTLLFLAPLCLLAIRPAVRRAPRRLAVGTALTALLTLAWLIPTVAASGGWTGYREALAGQREFINQTAVWTAGWPAAAAGLATHLTCLVNALGTALLLLPLALPLRRRQFAICNLHFAICNAPSPPHLAPFLLAWTLPSALFYLLVHFGSPGYAMTYMGAVLLATAWALEPVLDRLGRAGPAVLAGVALLNAAVFVGGVPFRSEQEGFGVMTWRELRSHERYWQAVGRFIRREYPPGSVAVLVPKSFTDGLRVAQYLLPEYWPATGLAVDPVRFDRVPAIMKPGYFRYITPEEARRGTLPTLCIARVSQQESYFRGLFGGSYHGVEIGAGIRLGWLGTISSQAVPRPNSGLQKPEVGRQGFAYASSARHFDAIPNRRNSVRR